MQKLEDHTAAQQGRRARPVVLDLSLGRSYGVYGGPKDQLRLNPSLVAEGSTPYRAMQTTLHEGRHAYQWDAVSGRASGTPDATVQAWRDNHQPGAYRDPATSPYEDYRFQPLEDDANRFATSSMESHSSGFSHDPGYRQFLTAEAVQTADLEKDAARAWGGADFREKIAADVSERAARPQTLAAEQSQVARQGAVNMDRVRMTFPLPADQAVGQPVVPLSVPWRGARASVRGPARSGRGE